MFFFNTAARLGKNDGKIDFPNDKRGISTFTVKDDGSEYYDQNENKGRMRLNHTNAVRTITLSMTEITMLKTAEAKINDLVKKLDNKKETLESSIASIELEITRLKEEYHILRTRFFKDGDLRRPHKLIKSFVIYLLLMLLLVIFEWPFNFDAFEQLFAVQNEGINSGEPPFNYKAAMLASGMSLALITIAHFVGIKLRQWKKSWEWKNYVIAFLGVFTTIAILYSLTGVRQINEVENQMGNTSQPGIHMEISTNDQTQISTDNGKEIYLGILSFGFIAAGIVLSYFSHDPDPEVERVYEQRKMLQKKLYRLLQQRKKLVSEHDRLLRIFKQKIEKIQNQTLTLILEYRDYNCKYRKTDYPSSANSDISLDYFKKHDLGDELDITDPWMLSKMKQILEDMPRSEDMTNNESLQLSNETNAVSAEKSTK